MNKLESYGYDGANWQARAVLSYVQSRMEDFKSGYSYNVGRWENGREQGYVITVKNDLTLDQFNIAFFEHRNTDEIHAIHWMQTTINTPNQDTAEYGDKYKHRYDTDLKVNYGQIIDMGELIISEIEKLEI